MTPEAINYLESNGLLKPSKSKGLSLLRLHKPKNITPSTQKKNNHQRRKRRERPSKKQPSAS